MTHDSEVGDACDRIIRMRDGLVREPAPVVAADRAAGWSSARELVGAAAS